MLYTSELTWNGKKGAKREHQAATNRMDRASLGAFRSTLLGIVAAESKLTPARALLNLRQARFAQRLLSRPRNQWGPEEVQDSRKQQFCAMKRRPRSRGGSFPGSVAVEGRESALQTAR